MKYRVGIAKYPDGRADAWVADFPGCRIGVNRVDEIQNLLPVAISDHLAWLVSHNEPGDPSETAEFELLEETEAGEHVFGFDREPLDRDELETYLRHARYAHNDLMALIASLPDAVLDWVPPASSVKIDIFPDVRSIRMMLGHVASAEANYYIASLNDVRAEPIDVSLENLHASSAARLRALSDEALSRVFAPASPRGETYWTARKVLRRIVYHLRFHTREIEQRRSWLTLGVPEVLPENRE